MSTYKKPKLNPQSINPHAYGIVKALQKAGFTSYVVGGCVRDLLLGIEPKDYDIATQASPEEVRKVIYRAYIIGRRFRLVLVRREEEQFEVSTFRRENIIEDTEAPVIEGDNAFGTPEEDALRRDFTINGLFYDPVGNQLIDFAKGLPDIEKHIVRMIGDPEKRVAEDPIRILRALRLAHKIGFTIEPALRSAMQTQAPNLTATVFPRRREEILKLLRLEEPALALLEGYDMGLWAGMWPSLHQLLSDTEKMETFVAAMHKFQPPSSAIREPADLFAFFIFAFYEADARAEFTGHEINSATMDRIQEMMRNELGMFKLEQTVLLKAFENLHLLYGLENVSRKGERRQLGFAKTPGLTRALQIAEANHLLPSRELSQWRHLLENVEPDEGPAPRRRRRPRRRGPAAAAAKGQATDGNDTN